MPPSLDRDEGGGLLARRPGRLPEPLTVAGLGFMVDVGNTDFWGITPVIVVTVTISQYETNPSRIYA